MKTKRFTSLVDRLHTFCKFFPVYFEMHECTRGVKSTLATGQANCVVFSETWVFFTKFVFAILEELLYVPFYRRITTCTTGIFLANHTA